MTSNYREYVIPAQPGFMLCEPLRDDHRKTVGIHEEPILAWVVSVWDWEGHDTPGAYAIPVLASHRDKDHETLIKEPGGTVYRPNCASFVNVQGLLRNFQAEDEAGTRVMP